MAIWLICVLTLVALIASLVFALVLVKCFCPTALFKLKNPPGFILHAIMGGPVPPYFSTWCWEEKYEKEVFRDGDVVACVAAKSGTTWMLNIVHQIRALGDPDNFLKHNTHTTPWPECMWHPDQTPDEAFSKLQTLDGWTNAKYKFRVYKSHYRPRVAGMPWKDAVKTYSVVPVRERPGVKYIICMREGKDVLASFYPFFAAHKQEFKDMWGGFPPTFKDFNENFNFFTKDRKGFYHGFAADWWAFRHDPNVLLLHYNDLKKDIDGCLRKIAKFVDVDVPESTWPLIKEKVSLQWMKEHEDIFKYHIEGPTFTGNIMGDEKGSMIKSGVVGGGKDLLTKEQEQIWEQLNEEYFGDKPGLKDWILAGGEVPELTADEIATKTKQGYGTFDDRP